MYRYADESNVDDYIAVLKEMSGQDSSDNSLCEALTDPKFRVASWVNIIYIVFHELTGINVINGYSN